MKKKYAPGARDASGAPPIARPEHCHPLIADPSRWGVVVVWWRVNADIVYGIVMIPGPKRQLHRRLGPVISLWPGSCST